MLSDHQFTIQEAIMYRIAQANINRFSSLLAMEANPLKRAIVIRRLIEEKTNLETLTAATDNRSTNSPE
jgi:hypothetical protein